MAMDDRCRRENAFKPVVGHDLGFSAYSQLVQCYPAPLPTLLPGIFLASWDPSG